MNNIMAITKDQLNLLNQNIIKAINGLPELKQTRECALAKTALQRSCMFIGLSIMDINSDGEESRFKIDLEAKFNFGSEHKDDEISDFIKELVGISKDQYLRAFDSNVSPENRPFFASHVITYVNAIEEAYWWLNILH